MTLAEIIITKRENQNERLSVYEVHLGGMGLVSHLIIKTQDEQFFVAEITPSNISIRPVTGIEAIGSSPDEEMFLTKIFTHYLYTNGMWEPLTEESPKYSDLLQVVSIAA